MKTLTKVVFKNSKRRNKKINKGKLEYLLAGIAFFIVFSFLSIVMICSSIYVTKKLQKFGQSYAFVNMLLLLNFLILFAKSIFEVLNVLYFSKDLKIFLRMPIKSKDILHAKLLNMIVSEYQMEFIMLAIPMIVYGIYVHVKISFYLYMVAVLAILPVIPIMITSLIIAIIMRLTNWIKNKNKVMYIAIILTTLMVGSIVNGFSNQVDVSVSSFENIVLKTNGLAQTIADYFVLIKPTMNILLNYDNIEGFKNLIFYIVESIGCYIVILNIISKIYLKGAIGTTINSNRKTKTSRELTIHDFKPKNKYISYLNKELKTICRSPIFLLQCIITPIVYPAIVLGIMAGMAGFAQKVDSNVMGDIFQKLLNVSGQVIFLSIGQVFFMTNFCSIINISRDGNNAILMKYIPIDLETQFNLKIFLGRFVNVISSIIVTFCYYYCTRNIYQAILFFAILFMINTIGEKIKELIDLGNPKLSWESEYTMMKENTNVLYELFITFIIILILAIISLFTKSVLKYLIIVLLMTITFNANMNNYISKNKTEIFKKVF